MFSGLVIGQATVTTIRKLGDSIRLGVSHHGLARRVRVGGSVAVNGCCLTVTHRANGALGFDLLHETWNRTTFRLARTGECVNLELPLRLGDAVGGHFVTGHVDCIGRIMARVRRKGDVILEIRPPGEFMRWITTKGSIAVDGVSLTVARALKSSFTLCVIPHTLRLTTLGWKWKGDFVNLEADLLARYAQKKTHRR